MDSIVIKQEQNESELNLFNIKLEPDKEVEVKVYISNCETCKTPIEPRLFPIKQDDSINDMEIKNEPNTEQLNHSIIKNKLEHNSHVSKIKEIKSPYSLNSSTQSNYHFKRSRSLSSSSSNFSYKPRRLMNMGFCDARPDLNFYHTNNNGYNTNNNPNNINYNPYNTKNNPYNRNNNPYNRNNNYYNRNNNLYNTSNSSYNTNDNPYNMNSSTHTDNNTYHPNNSFYSYNRRNFKRKSNWKKFRRWHHSNSKTFPHIHASQGIDNVDVKNETKPEMELRVVKMISCGKGSDKCLSENMEGLPLSHTDSDHQLQNSNEFDTDTLIYSENNDKISFRKPNLDKHEHSFSSHEEDDCQQLHSTNTLSQKSGFEESVPVNINLSDNEMSDKNGSQDCPEIGNQNTLTVCVNGNETATYHVLDEVNEVLIDNVEETVKLDVQIVEELPCDNDVVCVFSKLKEAHLCTKCFVEKRRVKKNLDNEVVFLKKTEHKDIPLIDIEH